MYERRLREQYVHSFVVKNSCERGREGGLDSCQVTVGVVKDARLGLQHVREERER